MPKYKVQGEGPYLIFDVEQNKCVSLLSFTTKKEAEAFIDMLERKERNK